VGARIAVVIGGASGIGAASARARAGDGWRVTVADRDAAGAAAVAAELGGPHAAAAVDVTDEDGVAAALDAVVAREGGLDAVVNCAGISTIGYVTDLALEEWRKVVDVDLTGGFVVLKHAGQRVRDGGVIVTITSLNARQPGAGMAAYCASKAGLAMLVQVAALELGPRGVRVNAIAPGLVETPLTEPALGIPGITEDYLENMPLGRPGSAAEVGGVVRFVCSDEAAWMTGETVEVNGGAHLRRYPDLMSHITKAFG
jgi:3-oxoacyl-[acyl-carrier protein] reductase